MNTPKMSLGLADEGRQREEMQYNDAMWKLDGMGVGIPSVISIVSINPGNPQDGDIYVIAGSNALGLFVGRENQVALYHDGQWRFILPAEGNVVYVRETLCNFIYRTVSSVALWRDIGPITDVVSVGALFLQTEVNGIVTTVNGILAELRNAGIIKT